MQKNYTYEELLEKIFRAKIALEGGGKGVSHLVTCYMEDPESYGPCNCGATSSDKSAKIMIALEALKL